MSPRILPILVLAATALQVEAAVTILHHFRLGDDDPGAVVGGLFNTTTVDSEGSADLVRTGSVLYASDVPFPSLGGLNNAFSARFSDELPAQLGSSTSLLSHTDNFGLELFVKFYDSDRSAPLAWHGTPSNSHFGILKARESFRGVLRDENTIVFVGRTVVVPFRWYHLALVRDQGFTTFYVDGSETGSSPIPPYPGTTLFRIGDTWNAGSSDGLIDEVRLFTFEPGEFSTEDLLINQVPEPATAGLLAVGLMGLLTRRRRRNAPSRPTPFLETGYSTLILSRLLPAIVIAATTISSHAAVKLQGYYRLGDDDPGALGGALFNSTTADSAGVNDLLARGAVRYSSDVPFPTVGGATNSLSAEFSGEPFADLSYGSRRLLGHLDNFGLELFVKVRSASENSGLVYDGKAGSNGFGVFQNGTQFEAFLGFSPSPDITFGSTAFVLNEWYHLALVRDQGLATFYVNGKAVGMSAVTPADGALPFRIGSDAGGAETLDGLIDEVRLFTFQPGTFSTQDLLINQVPEPSTAGMLAVGLMTLLTRKPRRIQPRNPMQLSEIGRSAQILPRILPLIVFALAALQAQATVTVLDYYRLGDADPGARSGSLFNSTTMDSVGGRSLSQGGSVSYSSDVPFPRIAGVPNRLSAEFSGAPSDSLTYYFSMADSNDNYGMEFFAKVFSRSSPSGLVHNGKGGTTGFGILQNGTHFQASLNSPSNAPTYFGATPFELDQWYHLALVRDEGLSTFYVDGLAVASSSVVPAGWMNFQVGSSVAGGSLDGLIDEVRLFKFQPGTFSTQDLLVNQVPEPATTGMLAVGLMTLLTRKPRRIQPRNPMQFPQGSRT